MGKYLQTEPSAGRLNLNVHRSQRQPDIFDEKNWRQLYNCGIVEGPILIHFYIPIETISYIFNPSMLTAAKSSPTVLMKYFRQMKSELNEGMLIRTLPSVLLQIFCKIILNFKVIIKCIKDPEDISG